MIRHQVISLLTVALLATAVPMTARSFSLEDEESSSSAERSRERAREQAREHERERREAVADAEEDLYDHGTDALDEHDWREAANTFRGVIKMKMTHAGAAMYWLAYAQNKMGQRSEALQTLVDLQQTYPKSRWTSDGKALEVEIRQSAGQHIEPAQVGDDELKLMALSGLMQSDPERAIPILEKILNGKSSDKLKDRALFVLTQTGSPQAFVILSKAAKDSNNRALQNGAVRYLGVMGGEESRKVLAEIYKTSNDPDVKIKILKSFMISGDRVRLLNLANVEPVIDLRGEAIRQLGILGAKNELAELYASEKDVDLRLRIIKAMFIGGNSEKLGEIARTEKVEDLRVAAIKNLGLLGGKRSAEILLSIYETDPSPEVRHVIINSLFIQGNAKALIGLARKEKDQELKKEIVQKLGLVGGKDAADYLMEFLRE